MNMAVELLEGFSIREYASRMRDIDVVNSWPFSSEDQVKKEVNVADFLPSITVTKFRWWSHEIDLTRMRDDVNHNPSVQENGEETDILARIEVNLSNLSEKLNLDCTATTTVHSGGCVGHGLAMVVGKKRKTAKPLKKRSIIEIFAVTPPIHNVVENKLKKDKKKIKLKKKISKKNATITKKKKLHKLKQQTTVNISESLSDDNSDAIFMRKCESVKKNRKVLKLLRKKHKPVIPNHEILKNKTEMVSSGKKSTNIYEKKRNSDAIPCKIHLPEKPVRFSGPGLQSKSNLSVHTDSAASEKEYYLEINRKLSVLESSGSDEDVSFGSDNRFEAQSLNEFDNWDSDDNTPSFISQEKVENLSYLSNNKLSMYQGNPNLSEKTSHAVTSKTLSPSNEGYDSIATYHNELASRDSNTGKTMIDQTAYMKAFTKPPSSSAATSEMTNGRVQSLSQTAQYEPFCHSFHKEIMGNNLHSYPKQKSVVHDGNHNYGEDFFGLPLNLQGELIQVNPRDKRGTNSLNVNLLPPKFHNYYEENHNFHNYLEENPHFHTQFSRELELTMMNTCLNGYKKYDPVQNQVGTDQTMRLMGKDVRVGKTNIDSHKYENGKVWTDKEIITEHCPLITGTENSVNRDYYRDWIFNSQMGKSKDHVPPPHLFDVRSSHIQSLFQAQTPNFKKFNPHSNNPGPNLPTFPTIFNQQKPMYISQSTCKHTHLNSVEAQCNHSLPQAKILPFNFPFLHPDINHHFEPSWFSESSKNLPPWSLHASQEKPMIAKHRSYMHHPHTHGSYKLAYLAHNSLAPTIPGNKPISIVNTGFKNKYNPKEKLESKPSSARNLDIPYKNRKRLADKLDESLRRRSKITNLGMEETNGASFVSRNAHETNNVSLGNSLGANCVVKRPGPHKLSAGVKHILKPNQCLDQDNSTLTHFDSR